MNDILLDAHVCTFSDKFVHVEVNGKRYHFEHTVWGGWVPTNADGDGVDNHPRSAWLALQAKHAPHITV